MPNEKESKRIVHQVQIRILIKVSDDTIHPMDIASSDSSSSSSSSSFDNNNNNKNNNNDGRSSNDEEDNTMVHRRQWARAVAISRRKQ